MIPGSGSTAIKLIKYTEVSFNYTCNTKFGEKIALIGNLPMLGHWDITKAIYLSTNPSSFPVWTVKLDLPRDKIIEYKYLIIQD